MSIERSTSGQDSMPERWELMTLGDVLKVRNGYAFKSTDYKANGVLLVRQSNLGGAHVSIEKAVFLPTKYLTEYSHYLVQKGDLLIGMSGSIGKLCEYDRDEPALQNQRTGLLELKDLNLRKWIWHFLPLIESTLQEGGKGVGVQNVSAAQIEAITIPIAPVQERDRIVAEIETQFSRLDDAVTNLKRVKANLKRYKAAVLKAAVEGRLVAAEAALARLDGSGYENGIKLLERIVKARGASTPLKQSEKEWFYSGSAEPSALPIGWVWASTAQLGHVQLGRQRSPKNRSAENPIKYLRAANITTEGLDVSDVLDMEFSPAEQARYRLRVGDILLSEASGSPEHVGKPAVWKDELPLCCFQNTVIRLRPTIPISPYLLLCFQSYFVNGVFAKIAGGVGINHLSADKFSRVAVPLPPEAEQHRIVAEVERRLSFVREVEVQTDTNLRRANGLRRAILSRSFSG